MFLSFIAIFTHLLKGSFRNVTTFQVVTFEKIMKCVRFDLIAVGGKKWGRVVLSSNALKSVYGYSKQLYNQHLCNGL